jgi:hypothetical protein
LELTAHWATDVPSATPRGLPRLNYSHLIWMLTKEP